MKPTGPGRPLFAATNNPVPTANNACAAAVGRENFKQKQTP